MLYGEPENEAQRKAEIIQGALDILEKEKSKGKAFNLAEMDKRIIDEEVENAFLTIGKIATKNRVVGPAGTGVGLARAAAIYSESIMPQLYNDWSHWKGTGEHRQTYGPNLKLPWEKLDQGDWP